MNNNTELEYYTRAPWVKMATEYAQGKMGDTPERLGWDRNDPILIGVFYGHMLEFVHQYFEVSLRK